RLTAGRIYNPVISQIFINHHEIVRSSGIAESGFVRLYAFHTPQHLNILCPQLPHRLRHVLSPEIIDENIGGEVAASGDHPLNQFAPGDLLADELIQIWIAIVIRCQSELTTIHYAEKSIVNLNRVG